MDLALTGMTCRLPARIEKTLNRLDGGTPPSTWRPRRPRLRLDPSVVSTDDLLAAVESIGYGGSAHAGTASETTRTSDVADCCCGDWLSQSLGVPVLVMSMVQRHSSELAVGIRARHAGGDMGCVPVPQDSVEERPHGRGNDGHVGVGQVLAAHGWSTYALFFTAAGDAGMKMSMSLDTDAACNAYLSGVGDRRPHPRRALLRARAKRRRWSAALSRPGATTARSSPNRANRWSIDRQPRPAIDSWPRPTDRHRWRGHRGASAVDAFADGRACRSMW